MTPEEFEQWKKVTDESKTKWTYDKIQAHNHGVYLFYKGGEDGTFIRIEKDGTAHIGNYEGAIPHIGEAIFHNKHSKKLSNSVEESAKIVFERLGYSFMMNFVFGI